MTETLIEGRIADILANKILTGFRFLYRLKYFYTVKTNKARFYATEIYLVSFLLSKVLFGF